MNSLALGLMGSALVIGAIEPGASVTVRMFGFRPDTVLVSAGDSVAWLNADDVEHTITADSTVPSRTRFDITLSGPTMRKSVRFAMPGVFPYHCERHAFMRGVVRVSPSIASQTGDLP